MKTKYLYAIGLVIIFMTSCQSVAEKVSGNYSGTYSASGLINNTGSGTLTLTPDGEKRVDMMFTSSGNPNVNIQDIDLTDLFGTYIFNLGNTQGGTVDVTGTIASGILAMTYDNSADTVSLSIAGFTK